ncbi:pre-mRNA splicing factor ATP-dependent RNA helicase Prp43 [Aspergillus luchuensis]|uniref:Pre-mRNA splicing factor ATP-dependent RNA helicase Prp43 n=1 Tax=Aspergillus kawachii TaxID=1069201 RepID=A0A146F8W1_ASPKA|nr:pre-mRNA splicing factor ATP-dependent RNA helicase Prp43 [Aspergillus luchuensis]
MLFALLMEFKGLLATSTMAVLTMHSERHLGKVNSDADHCFTTPEGDTNVVDPSDDLLMMVKAIEEEGDRDVAGTGIQCIHSYKFTHLPDKGAHGYLALACGLH